jgi:Flp pilus assembly protein TadG
VVIIYVAIMMVAMVGFCSLAVDLGRVQTAKTQLRCAVDAAARAAVCCLAQSSSAAQAAAIAIAAQNQVDGTALTLTNSNVVTGSWNPTTQTFTSGGVADNVTTYSAVKVTASRSKAGGNAIPLMFGIVIGMPTCDVNASAVGALIYQSNSTTQYVSANGNPWLAGEPAGTLASEPDTAYSSQDHAWKQDIANPAKVLAAVQAAGSSGTYTVPKDSSKVYSTDYTNNEPYSSPSGFALNVMSESAIQVSVPLTSANEAGNDGENTGKTGSTYANGVYVPNGSTWYLSSDDEADPSLGEGATTTNGTEHGLSNIIAPVNTLIGVFLDKNGATYGADSTQEANESSPPPTPSGLDFSTQAERDYTTIAPQLNQTFYVGNGQTSGGIPQTIIVPSNAYELFLGPMDGHEWNNNVGGFHASITQYQIQLVN